MVGINELSSLLFSNGEYKEDSNEIADAGIKVFYGYALADSSNGSVLVQIDDPIYSIDDTNEDDGVKVIVNEDEDQVDRIDEDEDPDAGIPEDELEEIFWTMDDDYAVEDDDESDLNS